MHSVVLYRRRACWRCSAQRRRVKGVLIVIHWNAGFPLRLLLKQTIVVVALMRWLWAARRVWRNDILRGCSPPLCQPRRWLAQSRRAAISSQSRSIGVAWGESWSASPAGAAAIRRHAADALFGRTSSPPLFGQFVRGACSTAARSCAGYCLPPRSFVWVWKGEGS